MNGVSRFDRRLFAALAALLILAGLTALAVIVRENNPPGAQIAYLAPSSPPFNLWVVDPAMASDDTLPTPRQLTFSARGVYDFAVSKDGRYIAYSEEQPDGQTRELMLFDLVTNTTRQLTQCRADNAVCTAPAWRPDGAVLAYARADLSDLSGGSVSRIWLLSLDDNSTTPLFDDPVVSGADPQWSPDGSRLAFYDSYTQAVLVYNFTAQSEQTRIQALPAGNGSSGSFAPNSALLIFPELLITSPTRAILRLANLDTGEFRALTDENEPSDDRFAAWHPDGRRVAVTRQYLDARYTEGDQVYMVEVATGAVQPLIFDERYQHSSPSWNADGTGLVLQRYAFDTQTPEIWVYTLATQALVRVAEDGFLPRWQE